MSSKCVVCTKAVYANEQISVDEKIMHKACLRCAHCNNLLTLGKYAAINGKFYCKPHFKQLFALKGNYTEGFNTEDSASSPTSSEYTTTSPVKKSNGELNGLKKSLADVSLKRSTQELHSSQDIKAVGKVSSRIMGSIENLKAAASPRGSNYNLSAGGSRSNNGSHSNLSEAAPGKKFGGNSAIANRFNQTSTASNKCNSCAKTVYPLEQLMVESVVFHKQCFRCAHCNNVISLGKYAALEGKYYCKPHFKQLFALKGNYNEGFGTRPHKEKWLHKDDGTESEITTA